MLVLMKHMFKLEYAVFMYNINCCTYEECKQTAVDLLRTGIHTCRLGKYEIRLKLRD